MSKSNLVIKWEKDVYDGQTILTVTYIEGHGSWELPQPTTTVAINASRVCEVVEDNEHVNGVILIESTWGFKSAKEFPLNFWGKHEMGHFLKDVGMELKTCVCPTCGHKR